MVPDGVRAAGLLHGLQLGDALALRGALQRGAGGLGRGVGAQHDAQRRLLGRGHAADAGADVQPGLGGDQKLGVQRAMLAGDAAARHVVGARGIEQHAHQAHHGGAAFIGQAHAVFQEHAGVARAGGQGAQARFDTLQLGPPVGVEGLGLLALAQHGAQQLHAARRVLERVVAEVHEHHGHASCLQAGQGFAVVLARAVAARQAQDGQLRAQRNRLLVAEAAAVVAAHARHLVEVGEAAAPLGVARGVQGFVVAHHAYQAAGHIVPLEHAQRGQQPAFAEQDALHLGRHGNAAAGQVGHGLGGALGLRRRGGDGQGAGHGSQCGQETGEQEGHGHKVQAGQWRRQ